jgi:uncharacterized protein with PIN domain
MASPGEPAPRFLVDSMAIKLGKYLRCLGYDAEWDAGATTRTLARRAEREERIFLTRNTRGGEEFALPPRSIELASDDPVEELAQVVRECALDVRSRLFTRCIGCNVELAPVADRESVRHRVAPEVLERYARFYTCPRCGTVFWKGSHVANTCRRLGIEPPEP